ncbi:MAG: RNA 2',3'-cyclic phosphodiesterase [Candidatus Omnitrophota bacterium]
MRAFIAISLPEDIKKSIACLQDKLKTASRDISWVKPENIHLTLKFLGEIDEHALKKAEAAMEDAAGKENDFYIRLSSAGAFPRADFPRVIWVGIDKGDVCVKRIAQNLEDNLSRAGFPKEKKEFSSHITIARVRSALKGNEMISLLNEYADIFHDKETGFTACGITLFKSTLTPKGPIYETVKTAAFQKTG